MHEALHVSGPSTLHHRRLQYYKTHLNNIKPVEVGYKKVRVQASLLADGIETARGEVVAVRIPNDWLERLASAA